jgi:arylsulfatase A-like enzyme/Flp pilus assembly protein TadD
MRVFRPAAIIFFAGAAFAALGATPRTRSAAISGPRNVLLITVDTLRADHLGCYGGRTARTPVMDGLGARSVLFERAFSHSPMTLPSHTSILLGLTPAAHGVHDNANFRVREGLLTMAEWLKKQGFSTGAFVGAFPLDSRFGLNRGFDVYDDNYGTQGVDSVTFVERKAGIVVDRALAWLAERKEPWFLWVHCFDPHQRYDPPEPFRSEYGSSPYDGEIAYVDSCLGRLFEGLNVLGETDRTAVVLTADHGESLGDHGETTHGYFAYNSTIRVPLLVSSPGVKPGRFAGNVSHSDIFPTVCGILGIDIPPGLEGVSLEPALHGGAPPARPIAFESLMAYYGRGWAPLRGYIEGNTKYIDSPIPEVYDLGTDFDERKNLADGPRLDVCRKRFAESVGKAGALPASPPASSPGREIREKLGSLGYLAGPRAPVKKSYSRDDDLKTLLPYQEKWLKAVGAYEAGRISEGIRALKEIITARSDFELAITYLATFYKKAGRIDDAVTVLREASRNAPGSYTILTAFGSILIDAGLPDEALEALGRAVSIIDFEPDAWNYIGVARWKKGDYEAALSAYGRALAIDGNYTLVFNNLGSLHLSMFLRSKNPESYGKALESFRRAIELDPVYASAYNGLGAALKFGGDLDGAIQAWTKAVELEPKFGYSLFNLGVALLAKGDKAGALGYLKRYRDGHYPSLPQGDRDKLDALIAECGR